MKFDEFRTIKYGLQCFVNLQIFRSLFVDFSFHIPSGPVLIIVISLFAVDYFQRVHLDIQVGEHAINYADVAQKEKLSELQLRVRQLLDQVEQITKEQNYQRVSKSNKDHF